MAYDEDLAQRVRELLAKERGLTEKKMFGGLAFLVGGNMAVAASGQGGLMVRCDPAESDRLTAGNYQLFIAPAARASADAPVQPVAVTDPSIFAQHGEWSRQQDRIVFERGNGQALGVIEVPAKFRS